MQRGVQNSEKVKILAQKNNYLITRRKICMKVKIIENLKKKLENLKNIFDSFLKNNFNPLA